MMGMIVCVALPAHAGVVGLAARSDGSRLDVGLLQRTAVWLLLAVGGAAVMSRL